MRHLLLTTIATVMLVGCGPSAPDISIHDAAEEGNVEAVKQAIADGADVNAKGDIGQTPLHWAANEGHKKIAELLISEGADVNAKGIVGETPLHAAVHEGHKEVAELLIAKGADVNAKIEGGGYKGETPLDMAEFESTLLPDTIEDKAGKKEIAALLRKHGAKSGAEDSIHIAARTGNHEAVKQHLVAGVDVNARDGWNVTPLLHAANQGHKEIAELLIANGAGVNSKAVTGETPLDSAIKRKHTETADLLRKHGGKTAEELKELEELEAAKELIHAAARLGNIEAVNQHIAAGTDVNAKNKLLRTPLFYAAEYGHKEIAQLLISEGADVNARKPNGGVPLHQAAYYGHKEVVELLIAKGADVNAKVVSGPKQGLTPLDAANETNHPETANLLRKHGGKTAEELKAERK